MSATAIHVFTGLSNNGPPVPCQIGNEQATVLTGRDPQGQGPLCWAYVVAGDGRFLVDSPINLHDYPAHDHLTGQVVAWDDCFGGSCFVSRADPAQGGGTIKFLINAKPSNTSNPNDRMLVVVSTGKIPEVTP